MNTAPNRVMELDTAARARIALVEARLAKANKRLLTVNAVILGLVLLAGWASW